MVVDPAESDWIIHAPYSDKTLMRNKIVYDCSRELGYPAEFLQREDGLYLASLDNLLDVVATQDPGFNHLMLFGHNPGLTDLVNYFVPGLTANLPTAGVVSVEIDSDDWSLYDRPEARLLVHDWPKKI